eukprot:358826-Chlamydomonas_euryale.AAC.11
MNVSLPRLSWYLYPDPWSPLPPANATLTTGEGAKKQAPPSQSTWSKRFNAVYDTRQIAFPTPPALSPERFSTHQPSR